MTIKALKTLYRHYQNPLTDIPEASKARDDYEEWRKTLDSENAEQAEDLFGIVSSYFEMQGFCYGFQYAMQIAAECAAIEKGGAV